MDGNPLWWQRVIPRYGNWGGPGWSAGAWNNNPALTDWGVGTIDGMDQAFKEHDWVYQAGGDISRADTLLVARLHQTAASGWYAKAYCAGAIFIFSARVWWFTLTGAFSEIPQFPMREHGYKQE